MYSGPPTWAQGKILIRSAPALCAVITSLGVNAPGIAATLFLTVNSTMSDVKSRAGYECGSRIQAGPRGFNIQNGPRAHDELRAWCAPSSSMTPMAPGTVIVSSTMGIPHLSI